MLANAACSLITAERITTTVVRAKQIRRLAEKMITLGKRGTLHARRRAIALLRQRDAVAHLFREVAPRYAERNGGYTRIVRLGQRRGDAAEMCILELMPQAPAVPVDEENPDAAPAEAETAEPEDQAKED